MIEIIPAIIAHLKSELEEKVKIVESSVGKVHLDIMDGKFVTDTTIGVEELEEIKTNLKFQVHLMTQKPEEIISFWVANSKVREIIFHIEATDKAEEIINTIRTGGKKVGVAINPDTPINKLDSVAEKVDFVQFMTVHPGKYGSDFVENVLPNITEFKNKYPDVAIAADGSIHEFTAQKLVSVGVSILVLGSHVFSESVSVDEVIENLRKIVDNT